MSTYLESTPLHVHARSPPTSASSIDAARSKPAVLSSDLITSVSATFIWQPYVSRYTRRPPPISSCGSMYGAGLASPISLGALGCMKSRRLGSSAGSERDGTRCGPADESRRVPQEHAILRATALGSMAARMAARSNCGGAVLATTSYLLVLDDPRGAKCAGGKTGTFTPLLERPCAAGRPLPRARGFRTVSRTVFRTVSRTLFSERGPSPNVRETHFKEYARGSVY